LTGREDLSFSGRTLLDGVRDNYHRLGFNDVVFERGVETLFSVKAVNLLGHSSN
jgi:hypothetical protein